MSDLDSSPLFNPLPSVTVIDDEKSDSDFQQRRKRKGRVIASSSANTAEEKFDADDSDYDSPLFAPTTKRPAVPQSMSSLTLSPTASQPEPASTERSLLSSPPDPLFDPEETDVEATDIEATDIEATDSEATEEEKDEGIVLGPVEPRVREDVPEAKDKDPDVIRAQNLADKMNASVEAAQKMLAIAEANKMIKAAIIRLMKATASVSDETFLRVAISHL